MVEVEHNIQEQASEKKGKNQIEGRPSKKKDPIADTARVFMI